MGPQIWPISPPDFVFTIERPHYSLALFSSFIYTCTFSKKIEFASKGLMKVQEKKKKCTKKRDARAKLFCCFFCLSEPIAFMPFSLKSPSSLLISFLNASGI